MPQQYPVTLRIADILVLAWPLTLKDLIMHGIVVVDAYLISSLGETALAAVGLAGAIVGLLLGIIFSFSTATQIRVAQSFSNAGDVGLKTAFYCGLFINLMSIGIGNSFCAGLWSGNYYCLCPN